MEYFAKFSYKTLYLLWAGMFVLTAVLGFLFPSVTEPMEKLPLQLATGAFFIPPWAIMTKANAEGTDRHIRVVRNLSLSSITATCVLMALNIYSAGMSEAVGNALNALLTVVSAPLVCSNFYVMPLFLWGTLLMGAFSRH